jgi:hypothetical protein
MTRTARSPTAAAAPVGPDNDRHIREAALETQLIGSFIICAWGVHGKHNGRGDTVSRLLAGEGFDLLSLDETRDGHPRHPLYLPAGCKPLPYAGAA